MNTEEELTRIIEGWTLNGQLWYNPTQYMSIEGRERFYEVMQEYIKSMSKDYTKEEIKKPEMVEIEW